MVEIPRKGWDRRQRPKKGSSPNKSQRNKDYGLERIWLMTSFSFSLLKGLTNDRGKAVTVRIK